MFGLLIFGGVFALVTAVHLSYECSLSKKINELRRSLHVDEDILKKAMYTDVYVESESYDLQSTALNAAELTQQETYNFLRNLQDIQVFVEAYGHSEQNLQTLYEICLCDIDVKKLYADTISLFSTDSNVTDFNKSCNTPASKLFRIVMHY
jgi:hypothetical protein